MNILEQFRRDEGRVLDRLVDGELSASERLALLAGLDDEPGAWRRCALAFLEAQAWRGQLSRWAVEPIVAAGTSKSQVVALSGARRGLFWALCLTTAASLMLSGGLWMKSFEPALRSIATVPADDANGDDPGGLAQDMTTRDATSTESASETVTLALDDDDDQIQLPIVSARDSGALDSLADDESAVPPDLVRDLEQAGLEVVRQQRLYPVELSDGRHLVVPIEELEIHAPQLSQYH